MPSYLLSIIYKMSGRFVRSAWMASIQSRANRDRSMLYMTDKELIKKRSGLYH
jgi:hypothetical protein